ncbi:MAG: hypothetical protein PW788_04740 [Micavibrio sp.]|nr:hypothetical protein [Micavibrio sp.]
MTTRSASHTPPDTAAAPYNAADLKAAFSTAAPDHDVLQELERHKRLNDLFLAAISNNDIVIFKKALDAGADVNYANGQPLQRAAQQRNFLFMKDLMVWGADVAYAAEALRREQSAIPRTRRTNDWGEPTGYSYKNKTDKARYGDIAATLKTLEDYQKRFISDIMPMESLRLQHESLKELRALKREMTEALHGTTLDKKRLPAPKPPRATND